jgi:hypothetical protein
LVDFAILLFQSCSRIAVLRRDFVTTVLPQNTQSEGRIGAPDRLMRRRQGDTVDQRVDRDRPPDFTQLIASC